MKATLLHPSPPPSIMIEMTLEEALKIAKIHGSMLSTSGGPADSLYRALTRALGDRYVNGGTAFQMAGGLDHNAPRLLPGF